MGGLGLATVPNLHVYFKEQEKENEAKHDDPIYRCSVALELSFLHLFF